jgi:membrane protein YdbS with pleckstrin-like domain
VPNNASKVRTISLIVLLATIAFGAVAYLMGNPTPLQLGALALVAVASLAMLVFSHRIVKDLERV